MTKIIYYNQSLCREDCNECVSVCEGKCLDKNEEYNFLILTDSSKCTWCESCYMVCEAGALNLQFIDDNRDIVKMND